MSNVLVKMYFRASTASFSRAAHNFVVNERGCIFLPKHQPLSPTYSQNLKPLPILRCDVRTYVGYART